MGTSERVFVIGLDGAPFELLKNFSEKGELKNLSSFFDEGSYGELFSSVPPMSPQSWPSIYTGVNPGKHGIFSFQQPVRHKGGFHHEFVNSTFLKSPPFWKTLDEMGKRSVLINLPITYPPEPINGVLISGTPAPLKKDFAYPKGLSKSLRRKNYKISPDKYSSESILEVTMRRRDVALCFLETEWDFFMVVFTGSDRWEHLYWGEGTDKILDYYKEVDKIIGRLLEKVDEDVTKFIVSDHGHGPQNKVVGINNWLETEGYQNKISFCSLLKKIGINRRKFVKTAHEVFEKSGLNVLKERLKDQNFTWKLLSKIPENSNTPGSSMKVEDLDWEKTDAFAMLQGMIYITDDENCFEIKNEIKTKLLDLEDPETNQQVVKSINEKEELYEGDCLDRAPDLVANPIRGYHFDMTTTSGQVFDEPVRTGIHEREGVILCKGPDVKNGRIKAHVNDIAPTILHLFGSPLHTDMDGSILNEIFVEDSGFNTRSPEYTASKEVKESRYDWDESDEAEIKENLSQLGYI